MLNSSKYFRKRAQIRDSFVAKFSSFTSINSGAPARAKRAWDRAPYSWNMVNLFSLGCHVTDRAYASTDCTGRVGETIKRKGGVSQACFGKSSSFIYDTHNTVN